MRNVLATGLVGVVLAVVNPAMAADDAVLIQANGLIQAGRSGEAYEIMNRVMAEHADDPDFDYTLGIAALDSRKPAEAIMAFQRALAVRPGFAQARAEIARAYATVGDVDTARREFDTVAGDPSIPDPVRRQFLGLVQGLDRVNHPGWSIAGYAQAGGGYDSNVNAATSASQMVIPLFSFLGPATLSSAAQQQGDGFVSAEGGVSADYGFDRQSHLFASLLGSEHATFDNHAFDQTAINATLGYGHSFASHDVLSLSGQGQEFLLGGNEYQRALGATAQYTRQFENGRSLSFMGQFFDIRYPTDPLRDAKRYAAGLTFSDATYFTSIHGGTEEANDALSRYLSNNFVGVRAGIERPLLAELKIFANGAYEHRGYQAADPLFLVNRDDDEFDLTAGLRWHVTGSFSLVPQITYSHNQSNIALYQYDRFTGGVSVRAEF